MQMTTEEKLEKALDFIRYIEKLPTLTASGILNSINSSAFCKECGTACTVRVSDSFTEYAKVEDLQDKAWHLLADLTF